MVAREEWLGYRHVASPMSDISGSTPVWAQYIYIYFDFQNMNFDDFDDNAMRWLCILIYIRYYIMI